MGDSKVAAMIFLFLGAFLLWLHSQGKLIPLFQQLFGVGLYGQKVAAAKAAPATGGTATVNLGNNPSLLTILSAIPGIVNGASKTPITTTPQINTSSGSTGALPGFDPSLPGANKPIIGDGAGYVQLPPWNGGTQ